MCRKYLSFKKKMRDIDENRQNQQGDSSGWFPNKPIPTFPRGLHLSLFRQDPLRDLICPNLVCMCVCVYVRHAQKIAKLFFSVRSTQLPFKLNILFEKIYINLLDPKILCIYHNLTECSVHSVTTILLIFQIGSLNAYTYTYLSGRPKLSLGT